ncbi:MAG TPA: HlyD family efflux transporter periplasmic adaptor subunit [Patescibacteria group bacterium]|jgi:RND family efflux transporter MFP subunit
MKLVTSLSKKLKYLWKTRRWWVIVSLVGLLLVGQTIYARSQNQETLNFISPTRQDLVKTLEVSGSVDAKEKASLRFLAGGKVIYLGAKEGDLIKKWQTIAQIDAASAAKARKKSLNLYSKERLDWDQQLDDVENRTIDQSEGRTVDKNQLDLENTVLDVEIAAITVANSVMSSPIAGILVQSPTNVSGVQLAATDTFLVVNPETLIFRALVDEADIALVQKNQSTTIELDAYREETITSAVDYIAYQSSTTASGTVFAVELPINSTEGLAKYRLGMNGDAKIKLAEKQAALTIPLIATRERDGKTFVDVRTGEKTYEEREIIVGLETEDYLEILSGLVESDEILLPE